MTSFPKTIREEKEKGEEIQENLKIISQFGNQENDKIFERFFNRSQSYEDL